MTVLGVDAVFLLSLLTIHLLLVYKTLILIQMMNSLMHYPIPILLNVKLIIWSLNFIFLFMIHNLGNQ